MGRRAVDEVQAEASERVATQRPQPVDAEISSSFTLVAIQAVLQRFLQTCKSAKCKRGLESAFADKQPTASALVQTAILFATLCRETILECGFSNHNVGFANVFRAVWTYRDDACVLEYIQEIEVLLCV